MDQIFQFVYDFLKWASKVTGFTYHEVNIISYYILLPGFFVYLIGRVLKNKIWILGYLTLIVILLMVIPDFELFSTYLFEKSVDFLNWFEKIGLDYVQASVVICVFIPILIIIVLFKLKNKNKKASK